MSKLTFKSAPFLVPLELLPLDEPPPKNEENISPKSPKSPKSEKPPNPSKPEP